MVTEENLKKIIIQALKQVAPDSEPESLGADEPIRDTLGIDSFDFLQLMVLLAEKTGVEIPEQDYGKVNTLNNLVAYLSDE